MKSSSELLLKPTDFSKVFIQLANLCQDPSVLGLKLINLIQKTPNDKGINGISWGFFLFCRL